MLKFFMKTIVQRKKWRKLNKHNGTRMLRTSANAIVKVGNYTYGNLYVHISNTERQLTIGNYCSIAENVCFVLNSDHPLHSISTFPFKTVVLGLSNYEAISKGDIIVEDDVWIGYGATIMSGVHIGQGAVVAAGAVVTKDVPPYAIVGGVPAKVIKYRFEPEMIEELLKVDYSKLTKEDIEKHIDDLYTELKDSSQLDWMPKRGE